MIFRNIGAGPQHARYPQAPPVFIIQSEDELIVVGCPPQLSWALEKFGLSLDKVSMILPLDSSISQFGGLDELGAFFKDRKKKPILACPSDLLSRILGRIEYPSSFDCKAITKVSIKEKYFTETISFVPNYRDSTSFGFRLEESKIFVSGRCPVNEDWLFKEMNCDLILHYDEEALVDLPIYLQNKIWIYGYQGPFEKGSDPIPMLYLSQGTIVYDSDRKHKLIDKNRHIKEATAKLLGREK